MLKVCSTEEQFFPHSEDWKWNSHHTCCPMHWQCVLTSSVASCISRLQAPRRATMAWPWATPGKAQACGAFAAQGLCPCCSCSPPSYICPDPLGRPQQPRQAHFHCKVRSAVKRWSRIISLASWVGGYPQHMPYWDPIVPMTDPWGKYLHLSWVMEKWEKLRGKCSPFNPSIRRLRLWTKNLHQLGQTLENQ